MSKWTDVAKQCLRDEAEALLALIPTIGSDFDHAVEVILSCKGKVIVTGVGKSGQIGAKIAATLSSTGTPSFFVNPLDVFHGDLGVITPDDVVLAISNSGHTDELLRFVPYLTRHAIPIIAITGNAQSLLAKNSVAHLSAYVAHEACPLGLAPTSSTTATLAIGDALACALIEARPFKEADFAQFHPGGSLGKRLLTKAEDVMYRENLPIIEPETPLADTLIHMSEGRLGLCVIEESQKIVGIITDGDLRRALQANHDAFFALKAADIMSKNPKTVSPDTPITTVENILSTNKIHAVIVADEAHHVLGIVDSFSTLL
ncbi:MAG: KpsF/GutQ family sugar-phosphate isomerase [Bacteroidaceae bacterium]|nr:KpsF/GutQ family sugar-phosphate isomerase [Bacteroidaceae bacterium]